MVSLKELYQLYIESDGVVTDTRKITKNTIFFALKGAKFDGNKFAQEAIDKGASYAVVDNPDIAKLNERFLFVEDTLKTLQKLANHHRRFMEVPVIAITGTNGKTTTKELISTILSQSYNVCYTKGNLNNHIGVPLTLLDINITHRLVVIEMGANKPGDIKELCEIAEPNFGIITNIGTAHFSGFGSLEGVRKTKGELYDWIIAHDGVIFRQYENEVLKKMAGECKSVTYGLDKHATVYGDIVPNRLFLSFNWHYAKAKKPSYYTETHLIGNYNISNALVAIAVGLFFSVDEDKIQSALQSYKPTNSRSQLIQTTHNTVISDAYNANPSSMQEAITNFKGIKTELEKVLILGDMNELGNSSIEYHQKLYDTIKKIMPDVRLILCGPIWSNMDIEDTKYGDVEALITYLTSQPIVNKFILVKGSNSIQLGKLISIL